MKRLIYILCLIVFIYSVYMIITISVDSFHNKKVYSEVSDLYHEAGGENPQGTSIPPEDTSTNSEDDQSGGTEGLESPAQRAQAAEERVHQNMIMGPFYSLLEINRDVVGWLHLPDTRIDYPVVQGDDNKQYIDHDIYQKSSRAGAVFMDYRNRIRPMDQNTILYGHHMKDGTMFKDLVKYKDEDFFREHRMISFDTLYEKGTWEIFSVYVTSTEFNYIVPGLDDPQKYQEFLNSLQERSLYKTDVVLTPEDRILTLSTCDYEFDDARLVVQARRVQ